YPSWPPSLIRRKNFAYIRGQQSIIGEGLIRRKIFAYIRSHKQTGVSSCFVVRDKPYYNLTVKGGKSFIILHSTAGAPHPSPLLVGEGTEPALLELSLCTS